MYKCFNPDCVDDRRSFSSSQMSMSTLMGWVLQYDEQGRPLNADPNSVTTSYICNSCGTEYKVVTRGWVRKVYMGDELVLEEDNTPDYVREFYADRD